MEQKSPKIDENSDLYETMLSVYDDINELIQKLNNMVPKQFNRYANKGESTEAPFRIVRDGASWYIEVKTSNGWKKVEIT